ncbi:hypothetical protein MRX96_007580 [Rhipicephalus microplus]
MWASHASTTAIIGRRHGSRLRRAARTVSVYRPIIERSRVQLDAVAAGATGRARRSLRGRSSPGRGATPIKRPSSCALCVVSWHSVRAGRRRKRSLMAGCSEIKGDGNVICFQCSPGRHFATQAMAGGV